MFANLHTYQSNRRLAQALSRKIAACIQTAVSRRNRANIAVSGGSTPVIMFQMLCRENIAWDKVNLTLVDERWVEAAHPDANARLVKQHLLQDKAAVANWYSLKTEHARPQDALSELERKLRPLLPFDVIILGMGDDGHTASFFPDAAALPAALYPKENQLFAAIESTTAGHSRITMTLPTIMTARQIFVHLTGTKKHATLERAMVNGETNELPIRAILHQDLVPVDVYYGTSDKS